MTSAASPRRRSLPLKSPLRNCSKVVIPSLLKGSETRDKGRAIPTRALGGENEDEGGPGRRRRRRRRRRTIDQSSF